MVQLKQRKRNQKGGFIAAAARFILPMVIGEVVKKMRGGQINYHAKAAAAVKRRQAAAARKHRLRFL